jgi:sulfotransferase family protein
VEHVTTTGPSPGHDWIELLGKAVLSRSVRRWIRRQRSKPLFQQHLRPTDVFMVGHPKSGNTWLAYMLAILLHKDRDHLITLANIGRYIPVIHTKDTLIAEYGGLPDPRMFRNEWPIYPDLYPKIIYLMRDPRSALVSLYHMYRTIFDDRSMTLEAFLEEYLLYSRIRKKKWPKLERWDRQVLDWAERAQHDERVILVKYEDMVENRQAVLEKVAAFAGIPFTEEDLLLATARGGFEAMRKDEEQHGAESYPGEIANRGRFIRRGEIDGWKQEMARHLSQRIEDEFTQAMKAAGYL